MPAIQVQRSILVDASVDQVFDTIADFGTWTKWSPWLCGDRDAKVTVTDDPNSVGSIYHWEGPIVGVGEIEHLSLTRPRRIEEALRFEKPYKSKADVAFDVESVGQQTKVTWHMNGRLPWFMFWMKSSMQTFLGMDYERGLKMLREFLETGTVLSKTEMDRIMGMDEDVTQSDLLVGLRDSCTLSEIGPRMSAILLKVRSRLRAEGITTDGDTVSAYHPVDLGKGVFDFTTGYTVPWGTTIPDDLESHQLSDGQAFHVRHVGSYENLGNAWSAAYQYARATKMKLAKRSAFEVYRNPPDETSPADLITDLYLPV